MKINKLIEVHSISVCAKCEKKLSSYDLFYRNGKCPHCKHESVSDTCDYKNVVYHVIKPPFWAFWKKNQIKPVGDFSENWIKNNYEKI